SLAATLIATTVVATSAGGQIRVVLPPNAPTCELRSFIAGPFGGVGDLARARDGFTIPLDYEGQRAEQFASAAGPAWALPMTQDVKVLRHILQRVRRNAISARLSSGDRFNPNGCPGIARVLTSAGLKPFER